MKKIISLLMCTLLSAVVINAQAPGAIQPLPTDPGTRVGHLDNGLTYYIRHNEYPKNQANFYIAQRVGSLQEEDNQRGLAHFLEHMCFNGTENFPGNTLIQYLESIGVKFGQQLNAYTSTDQTVYNINNVPTLREATIDSVLLILHDWSHNLTLDPEEIDKERGVIHEEWRMRSSAQMRILERQLPKLMSNSRPGNRLPIGTMEVVDNFKPEQLRAYYEKWYHPDLQAIIVVGDVDVQRTEDKIKELFSNIQVPEGAGKLERFPVDDNETPIVVTDHDKEQTIPVVLVMSKHAPLVPFEYRNSSAYLAMSLVKEAALSMLNTRIEEMTLDPDVPFIQAGVDDGNFLLGNVTQSFEVQIVPKEGKMQEAITKVMAEVYRAAEHGFTASEYSRWSSEKLSSLESEYQNKDKRQTPTYIQECVQHFLNNHPMPGIEMEHMYFTNVLPQLPLQAVNQLFGELVNKSDRNLVILNMNPEKEGYVQPTEEQLLSAVHQAQQMNLKAYVDNVKNEPLIKKLPKKGKIVSETDGVFGTKVLTLSNGVRVLLKQTDFKDNEVLMKAYSDGGTGRYGVEDKYTLEMFDELVEASGLGNFTSTELSKALAGVQATVSASFGPRSEYLEGNSVPKDLRTMFELIYLHFRPLHRDDKAVASVIASTAEALRNQAANPVKAFRDSLDVTRYGNNPRMVIMQEEDLAKVSYKRALKIYKERFADASDFTFQFVGNFDNDSIRLFCEQYLATLPRVKRNDSPVDSKMNMVDGVHENIFRHKMEQPACTALMLLHADAENSLYNGIVSSMLGQALQSRLLETIREEMGAAYSVGASASLAPKTDGSHHIVMQIYAPLKPEMCDTSRVVIQQELERLATSGAEDKYLNKSKEYMLKTYREALRKNGQWIDFIEDYLRFGIDGCTDYESVVQSVTSADIQKMARKMLDAGNRITVIMLPEE